MGIKELKQKRIEEKNKDQVNSVEKKENKKSRNIPNSKNLNISTQQKERLEKEKVMKKKSLERHKDINERPDRYDKSDKGQYKSHQHSNNVKLDKVADEMARLKKERMIKRKLMQSQASKGEPNKQQTNSNGVTAEIARLKKERKFQRENMPATMVCSNKVQSKSPESNFISSDKYNKSLTNALNKMTKSKKSAVAAFASLNTKKSENNFINLSGEDGFNNGFLPKSKTRITPAEFKKMRALAKLKDKNGKVNLD